MKLVTESLYPDQSKLRNCADFSFFTEGNKIQGIILNPLDFSYQKFLKLVLPNELLVL